MLDLSFVGMPDPNHDLFYRVRRIFSHFQPCLRRNQQRDCPCLTKFQRARCVLVDEGLLHRCRLRREAFYYLRQFRKKRRQPRCQIGPGRVAISVANMAQPIARNLDDPPSGPPEPRIDAQNFHASYFLFLFP